MPERQSNNRGEDYRHRNNNQNRGGNQMPFKIKAPYNFVPLSKYVFFPEWAQYISQDVPFEDGVSGTIKCRLTAQTPIYIRNGGLWEHKDIVNESNNQKSREAQSFFKINNKYMIPGSSIKGMLRSVIEIASFGKIGNKINNNRYSIRDLTEGSFYREHMSTHTTNAGWLKRDKEDNWFLIPCNFEKISQDDLISLHPNGPDIKKKQRASDKYNKWKGESLDQVLEDGTKDGQQVTIVFTGQPADNNGAPGRKKNEFLFFNEKKNEAEFLKVDQEVREDFEFIHSKENGDPNEEWGYWRSRLNNKQKVPVFFQKDSNGGIHSIGLAYMYRLPYEYNIGETIRHTSPNHFSPEEDKADLAECMFGYVKETTKLKGRVSITHAEAEGTPQECSLIKTVLNGPKPTYYPNYIEQDNLDRNGSVRRYKTYMDATAEIRGWKRYPARKFEVTDISQVPSKSNGQENLDVATKFRPLDAGTTFIFNIHFHNLRKVELGTLLWALTWNGNKNLRHNLGMAKPFGFGQVSIEIIEQDCRIKDKSYNNVEVSSIIMSAMKSFRELMQNREDISGGWKDSNQIKQLLAMANPDFITEDEQRNLLQYQKLKNAYGDNEFVRDKKAHLRLEPYAK